jgi:Helix-turn-helix domain
MMTVGYMTTAEVAARFRRPEATVRWWRYTGYGPESIKVGKAALYPVEAVEAFEAQLRAEAAEKTASRMAGRGDA